MKTKKLAWAEKFRKTFKTNFLEDVRIIEFLKYCDEEEAKAELSSKETWKRTKHKHIWKPYAKGHPFKNHPEIELIELNCTCGKYKFKDKKRKKVIK